jgi:hypothetical protein
MVKKIVPALVLLVMTAGCVVVTRDRPAPVPTAGANETVTKSLTDVERFWTATFPELSGGKAFHRLSGGYHPYTETDPPPACGAQAAENQPNAF